MTFAVGAVAVLAAGIVIEGWGCLSLHRQGRAYVAGRHPGRAPEARASGLIAAIGALIASAATSATILALASAPVGSRVALAGAAAAFAAAGAAALLGGLSGKPAPSADLACALWLTGLVTLVVPLAGSI